MSKEKIYVSKVDEVYLRIDCDKGLAQELSTFFTFFVPGHQFTPAFRKKIWDGKLRLFDLRSYRIYQGLFEYIQSFCDSRGYELVCAKDIGCEDEFSIYHAKKFFESLNLHSNGKKIEVRQHQLDAFVDGMQRRKRLFLSPTSSGKSLIIYLFFRQLLDFQKLKGLIVVPTTSLVEQLFTDFEDYSSENGFDVESNVHKIYQGKDKNTKKSLTISTWQSIYNQPEEYFKQFDYVIGDEAHLFKANSLVKILTSTINSKYRIGLTGSLDGTNTHKLVLEGVFGPVKSVITTKELMDKKEISDFEIKCLILKHPEESAIELLEKDYAYELDYLIKNQQRNKFIKNLALSLDRNTLILYQMVDKHGKILYNIIKDAEKIGNRKVFFVHGKTETEDRELIRTIMEKEKDAIVVASFGTFSTGINIRNLHNVIFASPSKSRVRSLQSIGRVLRQAEGKTKATLYDIADDLRVKDHMNFTLKHFVQRVRIYTEEKFSFKTYKIGLKNEHNKDS
jgi:superfamily II DNA or RNA helicase